MCEIKMLQEGLTFCAWKVIWDPINLQMQSWVLAVNWCLDKRYNIFLLLHSSGSSGSFFCKQDSVVGGIPLTWKLKAM